MAKQGRKAPEFQFVRYKLGKDDISAMKAWFAAEPDYWRMIQGAVFAGHKLSVSWSDENDTFYTALTCTNEGSKNRFKVLTSRHSDLEKSLAQVAWLITQFLPEEWPTEQEPEDELW